jgi:hypothetical protein
MARITIATRGGVTDKALVRALRKLTNASVAKIAGALRSGDPIFDAELFSRPQVEQFSRVRDILAALNTANVEAIVVEGDRPITAQILINIMRSSEEEAAEFERLSELGHDA